MRMAWHSSDRRDRLPANWSQLRLQVLRRDRYQCQVPGCPVPATDVDHVAHGDDNSPSNLQSLCGPHHAQKSAAEGHARLRELRAMTKRKPEPNPGFIPPAERKPPGRKGW